MPPASRSQSAGAIADSGDIVANGEGRGIGVRAGCAGRGGRGRCGTDRGIERGHRRRFLRQRAGERKRLERLSSRREGRDGH